MKILTTRVKYCTYDIGGLLASPRRARGRPTAFAARLTTAIPNSLLSTNLLRPPQHRLLALPRALEVHARLVAHVECRRGRAERRRKAPERGVDREALQPREQRRRQVRRLRVRDEVGHGALFVLSLHEAQQVLPKARRSGGVRVLPEDQYARVVLGAVVERLQDAVALLEARAQDTRKHDLPVFARTFWVRFWSLLFCSGYLIFATWSLLSHLCYFIFAISSLLSHLCYLIFAINYMKE